MTEKENLIDIAILRCFATISLVVWHTYCSYICWDVADTPANQLYRMVFTRIIPDANMPLFTILAGYLFHYLFVEKGKYQNFKKFLHNKINRLLIPFLVLGTAMNLTQYGKAITDIIYGVPNHLWYCLMLFYVYIAFWLIEQYCGTKVNKILSIFSLVLVTIVGLGAISHRVIGGLFIPAYYYCYFFFGFYFRKNIKKWKLLNGKYTIILVITVYLFSTIDQHLIALTSISYFLLLYTLVNTLVFSTHLNKRRELTDHINMFCKYSFGIYVFHQYILWNLTREPHCLLYIKPLLEKYYIIAPIILVMMVLSISYLLTHYSLKTKLGRFLLL